MGMHEGEEIAGPEVLRRLLVEQAPEYATLPVVEAAHGTDNTMYRLGEELLVRLPRTKATAGSLAKELKWLPWLAPQLDVEVPEPVYAGEASSAFGLPWAIYRWIDGDPVTEGSVTDWAALGRDLAGVVGQLRQLPVEGKARAGELSGYRGGLLQPHDEWVRECLAEIGALAIGLDVDCLSELWASALELPPPSAAPVWLHGDLKPTNLLVRGGALAAVIDFGGLAIGYPDAEHAPVWDLPQPARTAYRRSLPISETEWQRARAWALLVGASGVPYYWTSYPEFAHECVRRLHAVALAE